MFDLSSVDLVGIVIASAAVLVVIYLLCVGLGACVEWFERMDGED